MKDLIDRNELLKVFEENCSDDAWLFIDQVEKAPGIEAEPVRYGHWILNDELIKSPWARNCHCSECGFEPMEQSSYCPNCGCKMRKEDVE